MHLKAEEWTPVFKTGDGNDQSNYLPIIILNSVDKMFESLLCKQVMLTMDPHLYQKLSSYRKDRCETTVLRLIEDWKAAIHGYEQSVWLVTPYLNDSESQGIQLLREICYSYVLRKNQVKLQNLSRVLKEQTRGGPQGSSFRPLLWNLFQNNSHHIQI